MNTQHGILIRADTHNVSDVYALIWNGHEIRNKLFLHDGDFVYQDISSDTIVVEAPSNVGKNADARRKDGFELFGRCFYGNALIIPDEGRASPRITPLEIAHKIRFFRWDDRQRAREQVAA